MAREAGSREVGLVPVAVLSLVLGEPGSGAKGGVRVRFAGGDEAEERPGRLRGSGLAPAVAGPALVPDVLRAAVLSKAALLLLY